MILCIRGLDDGYAMIFAARTAGHRVSRLRAAPATLLIFLLLALLAQATAVQTHVHVAHGGLTVAAAPDEAQAHSARADTNGPATACRWCQEAALAGAYVLPSPPVFPAPPVTLTWVAWAALAGFILGPPALGWQSRAPPQ